MCSLAVANQARAARTALKNELATGRASIEDVLILRCTTWTRDSLQ